MRQRSIRRVLCTACAAGAVAAANAEEMYAVDSSSDELYVIDSVSGAVVRTIGPLHPDPARFTTPVAMAVRADGVIFINNNSPAGDDGLARVDPATGLANFIGGASSQLDQAISFGPGGVLYGTDAAGELATVNQVTGAVTSVGGPALPRLYGLAFRRADGFLYGITTGGPGAIPDLLKINPATGVAVSTIALSSPIGGSAPGTLIFDSCGTLIGSDNGSNLYDIDPATGVVSSFRSAAAGPQGMGRIPACKPSMWAVDSSSDSLYVINTDTGALVRTVGRLHPDPARFTTPVAMAVRPTDGAIFVSNNSPAGDDGLARVDPATGLATYIGLPALDGALAFGPGNNLYGTDGAGELVIVDPVAPAFVALPGGALPRLFGLDFNRADGFFYGITSAAPGAIPDLLRISPGGALVATIPLSAPIGGSAPGALVFDKCGILIGSDNASNLYDISVATGAVTAMRAAGALPQGMGLMTECYADCDGNGALDFFDFLCFQDAFGAGDCSADCDGSGGLDFFDFLCFQNAFAAGCP